MKEWESQKKWRKEKGEGGFCREKKEELGRIWRDEGDEKNEEEKEMVGNHWEKKNEKEGTHLMAKLHVV